MTTLCGRPIDHIVRLGRLSVLYEAPSSKKVQKKTKIDVNVNQNIKDQNHCGKSASEHIAYVFTYGWRIECWAGFSGSDVSGCPTVAYLGFGKRGDGERAQREPITGAWELRPQRGSDRAPGRGVRGAKPP